nr:PP2C family protein-serine/threonine phosphatase [Pseudodesulfovibrio sp.]
MGIRYKLLILLLLISLAPLLVVRTGVQKDLLQLGESLAVRSSNTLVHKASTGLKRIVEDHARVLKREKQLLESSTLFLASKIEGVLYGHSHTMPDQSYQPPTAQIPEAQADYYSLHMRGRRELLVDFTSIKTQGAKGSTKAPDVAHLNSMLLPLLGQVKFEYPKLTLWIEVRLPDGNTVIYPKPSDTMPMMRGRNNERQPLAQTLSWSPPTIDSRTRRIAFRVTAPIRDAKGGLQGSASIVIPVGALLHKSHHVSIFSEQAISILVAPEVDPKTNESRLKVIAREIAQNGMRNHWIVPEEDAWLISTDKEQYGIMMNALRALTPGVTEMPYEGNDALWAYAPIDQGGAALMIIVPKTDIVREALTAKEFILTQVGKHDQTMSYVVLGVALLVIVLAFLSSKLVTRNVSALATAVGRVAKGDFSARADVRGKDEIGQLGQSFNKMVPELEERVALKNSLEMAQQVQQDLLPSEVPHFRGADIAATSMYCDETGGDYFGFIPRREGGEVSLVVAVGDVSGHGVPAALMMSSARAYLRSHIGAGEPLHVAVQNANRLISEDVDQSGRFMTLFLLELTQTQTIRWVRAGHDPALVYSLTTDDFEELGGDGLPLGVINDVEFELNERSDLKSGQLVIVGTDGIWEMTSPDGEMFGKDRLKALIRDNKKASAAKLIEILTQTLNRFRGEIMQEDDITIAIVRLP